ncbi:hypothetical protein Celaphus_00018021, partial [Cervus elaphus hippelaphus]
DTNHPELLQHKADYSLAQELQNIQAVHISWLTLTLPDQPEAPPNYEDVAWEEEFSRHTSYLQPPVRGSQAILRLSSLRNQISDSASLF